MKTSSILMSSSVLLLGYPQGADGFSPVSPGVTHIQRTTSLAMFSGGGAGAPKEDNPEEEEAMRQAAASMGLTPDEYKLAMAGRVRLAELMDSTVVAGGNADSVLVERDVNNPPKKFDITITEAGKAKGKETVAKELVAALKSASDKAKKGRMEAQVEMNKFIASKMKP
jgi:hypothetical protein